jgi:anti-sigma B factor antagonist
MGCRPETDREIITIGTEDMGGTLVVTVSGDVDVYSGSRLRATLREVIDAGAARPVLVDLTSVTLLSSTGCAVLVDALHQAQERNSPFAIIVDPASRAVPLTLSAAGLVGLFTTYDDIDQARQRTA